MACSLEKDDAFDASFMDNFSCKICLEVLNNPMQCQNNEHYFCSTCITKHLENSSNCPLCNEELTVETLRAAPRIIATVVSQFKIPRRCDYVGRGCKDVVNVEELPFHHKVCGFAPVVCSNEGCGETVNKQDKESHESESCVFRKTKCDCCGEEVVHKDHAVHRCSLRKEIDEIKLCLERRFQEIQEEQKAHNTGSRKEMEEMKLCLKSVTNRLQEIQEKQKAQKLSSEQGLENINEQLREHRRSINELRNPFRCVSLSSVNGEPTLVVDAQIFVAGGHDGESGKSLEVFNWSTKSWTLFKDFFFHERHHSFLFTFGEKIMICGGETEYFNPKEQSYSSSTLPLSISDCDGKGVRYGNEVFTFGDGVRNHSIEPPRSFQQMIKCLPNIVCESYYGVECFEDNVLVAGGKKSPLSYREKYLSEVKLYDIAHNEWKTLPPLPYPVAKMATVPYKDNMIIIGGEDQNGCPLNSVFMYSLEKKECKKLPSMLEKRSGCAAVIMGEVIVVMGGSSKVDGNEIVLKTMECHILESSSWKKLPPMNLAREGATACVYV